MSSVVLRVFAGDQDDQPRQDTLEWFAGRYEDHLGQRVQVNDYSPRRLKGTMAYVHDFMRYCHAPEGAASVRVGSLTPGESSQVLFTSWLTANLQRWKKGSTRADAIGAVLGCFNWLEEQEYLTNPFRRPRNLRCPRTHFRAMRKHHYRSIQRVARKVKWSMPFRRIFFACWHAGVRLIEFRQLTWDVIDWDVGVIRIPPHKHKTGRKKDADRIVGLGPRLLSFLRGLSAVRKPGQKFVFLSKKGKAWGKDCLGRVFARWRSAAGVPEAIKMCGVRHGYAVRVLSDGQTSHKGVADQLGHESTRMVESIYAAETKYDAEVVREVAQRAERGRKRPAIVSKPLPAKPYQPLFEGLS